MKKKISRLLIVIIVLIGSALIYISIDPELPIQTDQVIAEITSKKIPELVDGETGFAKSGTIKLWYELKNKSPASKGTVLLINGFGEPSTSWNQTFIKSISDSGYQVLRFDNRDTGLSDWIENWDENKPYSLDDMMADAIAVLDQNGIDKAHIVGYSMGGYIAQKIALKYPERVLSMTTLSSSADLNDKGHPTFDWAPMPAIKLYVRTLISGSDPNFLKLFFKSWGYTNGNDSYDMNLKLLGERILYELHRRRGFNPNTFTQQMAAIKNSSSNYNELDRIKVPTLVVHGMKDPILSFELAKKYGDKLQGSKRVWIKQAGHLITNDYVEHFSKDFFKMLNDQQKQ